MSEERKQALEAMAQGKEAPKSGTKLGKKRAASGDLAETASERQQSAAVAGQKTAINDVSAYAGSYAKTFADGVATFNQVAAEQILGMVPQEVVQEVANPDFLLQHLTSAFDCWSQPQPSLEDADTAQ